MQLSLRKEEAIAQFSIFCIGKTALFPTLYLVLNQSDHMANTTDRKIHQGRNIKRFREMLGIKQEVLAHELGEDWS